MKTIAIVGSGNFGANAALYLAEKNLAHVILIDQQEGLARGKALDLMEAAPVRGFSATIEGTHDLNAIEDVSVVIIAAGLSRSPQVSEHMLLEENLKALGQVAAMLKRAAPGALVIMQRDPVALLTNKAIHEFGLDPRRVIGLTGLTESARYRYYLAKALGVSPRDTNAMVIGGPGRNMVPLAQYANVSGMPVTELLSGDAIDRIADQTRQSEEDILNQIKRSAYYTPAATLSELMTAIVHDKKRYLPVTVQAHGEYGLEGVCLTLPALIGENGVESILQLKLTSQQERELGEAARYALALAA